MHPDAAPLLQAPARRLRHSRSVTIPAFLLALAAPWPAFAQDEAPAHDPRAVRDVAFEANQVAYDSESDIVTASGDVILRSEGQTLNAQNVSWNRKSGQITAHGNILLTDTDGNKLYTDSMELTDELKAGAMQNMLLAFSEGGRLAARQGNVTIRAKSR